MSLFERLLIWLGVIPPSILHQYRQDEDLRGLTLESVRQEQRSDEEINDASTIRHSRRATSGKLIRCWETLSPREQEVAALICLDYTNDEIASKLNISATTVKSHIRKILTKFQMHSKIELSIALEEWDFTDWDRPPYR